MEIHLKDLEDQVIVITGASSGIGMATAEMAARQGARVVLAARSANTIKQIARRLTEDGHEAIAIATDVTNRSDIEHLASSTRMRYGTIDTWVNNAGLSIYGRIDEISEDDHRQLFEVNYWGVVYGSLVALHHMRNTGGAIINLGSEVSEAVVPLQGIYSVTKHAVKGFTDALRLEIEEIDQAPVSITLIQPTAVNTPFPQHARNYMSREPKLPDPMIDPDKVARAILNAATSPTHHTKVGAMSKINTFMANNAPRLADRMAKSYVSKQQRQEAPRRPEGTLYRAGEEGRIRGESNRNR